MILGADRSSLLEGLGMNILLFRFLRKSWVGSKFQVGLFFGFVLAFGMDSFGENSRYRKFVGR